MTERYQFDPTKYEPTAEEVERLRVKPDKLKLSGDGIFFTIQGEGQSIGKPSVFMRLQMCNLECNWPCDTPYTWQKDDKRYWQEPRDYSYSQLAIMMKEAWQSEGQPRMVITGGEPMIQQKQITEFISLMDDWNIEIETNGTIPPNEDLAERVQFNVSPKLENSANPLRKRYRPETLKKFNALPKTTFKFVVQSQQDIDEIQGIIDDCQLDPNKIIIMPEGMDTDTLRRHAQEVEPLVKEKGWRLTTRMHIDLYGNKRAT